MTDNMIIDTHIHAYTDSLAERVVKKLSAIGECPCYTDGTIAGARELLKKSGIDYGVILPIATKPTQQTTINNWVKETGTGSIIPFGTVHPLAADALDELEDEYTEEQIRLVRIQFISELGN